MGIVFAQQDIAGLLALFLYVYPHAPVVQGFVGKGGKYGFERGLQRVQFVTAGGRHIDITAQATITAILVAEVELRHADALHVVAGADMEGLGIAGFVFECGEDNEKVVDIRVVLVEFLRDHRTGCLVQGAVGQIAVEIATETHHRNAVGILDKLGQVGALGNFKRLAAAGITGKPLCAPAQADGGEGRTDYLVTTANPISKPEHSFP